MASITTLTIFQLILLYFFIRSKEKLNLYIHDRDSNVGAVHHEERVSAMKRSRKIIVVLSNSYVNSSECQGEASLAGEYKISTWEQCTIHVYDMTLHL